MGVERLAGVRPGRFGLFLGSLAGQTAAVERRVAAEIEELGIGTLWYGEAVGREVFAHGAILLAATERLVVASGIANIWARDPQAMAAGGRALAEAWPQRFILGIGVSHAPMVERRGHSYDRPVAAMREYLDAMDRAAWRGPEAPMPPVVLAALGPRMVALAAEKTAGDYTYFSPADHVREVRAAMGSDRFLAADLPVVLAYDRANAREIGNRHTQLYLSTSNYRNNLMRLGWSAEELEPPGSDRLFDAIVAWGDVDQVQARASALFEAGADQVVLNLITKDPTVPYEPELRKLSPLLR
ncbi:MAG TPA: TIGR03620 family F420-dependent LLM class oxidoreductase [Candidatus Dormibacteraeota bacterium]|nr:TIGR03620 family F420-dependent LLM class oxidoreductase [Candidatus Dormibacteraeota bacterium]